MRISRLLREELIEPNLTATEKEPVLQQLVAMVMPCLKNECATEAEHVLEALRQRESITSTGIGTGIAIPHAKVAGLKKMMVGFARSRAGVNFQALDDAPVNLFFLVVAPPGAVADYLKILAAISAFLRNETNRNALMSAETRAEILAAIKAGEIGGDVASPEPRILLA